MEKGVAKASQANENYSENTFSSVTGISSTGDRSFGFGFVVVVELYGEVLGNRMRLGCSNCCCGSCQNNGCQGIVLGQDALIKGIC
ncbi:hypothetical protein RchiOBHm_Chr4g0392441 [Rosa chinensis]|uniref:Uncharacterized protein n=1 Tax=Rosa chinensis TaxID=74649 RepID=A0A2P6QQQ7_ROSCH|nr:hypothetical protein RchiOBHm_Chr4g0392441 [Rosa chinensis]